MTYLTPHSDSVCHEPCSKAKRPDRALITALSKFVQGSDERPPNPLSTAGRNLPKHRNREPDSGAIWLSRQRSKLTTNLQLQSKSTARARPQSPLPDMPDAALRFGLSRAMQKNHGTGSSALLFAARRVRIWAALPARDGSASSASYAGSTCSRGLGLSTMRWRSNSSLITGHGFSSYFYDRVT